MVSSFVKHLEDLAVRGVLYRGIGSITCSGGGAQLSRDIGMARLGRYALDPDSEVWELTGAALATSLFAQKSAIVREAYSRAFL